MLVVKNTNLIRDVKVKTQEEECIPQDKQLLVFPEKQLKDDRTLSYCNIYKNDTVHLVKAPLVFLSGY